MHVATFIGELQHYKNFKPSYLSTGKWAINLFLSDHKHRVGKTRYLYTQTFHNQDELCEH